MTDYVDGWPTARRRHRCGVCCRSILPGETYWRQASLDHGQAWTHKTCERCERVACAFCRVRASPSGMAKTRTWSWRTSVTGCAITDSAT